MGAIFRWFKRVELSDDKTVNFIDTDRTSHTYSNAKNICDLFEKYGDIEIPYIESTFEYDDVNDIGIIDRNKVIEICDKLLNITDDDMIKRYYDTIVNIKELSKQGYYIIYIM